MKTSEIVVGITVSRGAAVVNSLHVVALNDRPAAALGGLDWRGRAAHVNTGLFNLGQPKAVRWREVPLLAGRKTSYGLKICHSSQTSA